MAPAHSLSACSFSSSFASPLKALFSFSVLLPLFFPFSRRQQRTCCRENTTTSAAQSPSPYYLRLLLRLACLRFALRSSLRARLARFGNISRNGFGAIAR